VLSGPRGSTASSVTSKLTQANTLALSTTQAATIGTVYLAGEVVGALFFGRLSDQLADATCSCGRSRSTW
jgi:MFS family permease